MSQNAPVPAGIELHRASRTLELRYADGQHFTLPCELLRVYSPSAEVRGHGPGQEVLVTGKRQVGITAIRPVGNYALQLTFSDGHDTGLFSWGWLWDLCQNQERHWDDYLRRLHEAGASRDPDVQVVRLS